jgi:hypothetical protein
MQREPSLRSIDRHTLFTLLRWSEGSSRTWHRTTISTCVLERLNAFISPSLSPSIRVLERPECLRLSISAFIYPSLLPELVTCTAMSPPHCFPFVMRCRCCWLLVVLCSARDKYACSKRAERALQSHFLSTTTTAEQAAHAKTSLHVNTKSLPHLFSRLPLPGRTRWSVRLRSE